VPFIGLIKKTIFTIFRKNR